MHYLPTLLQLGVIYFVAAASPGPNFFMVTQRSLAGRRSLGVASALGVATASITWATLAMAGLAAVLQRLEWVYTGIRFAGAAYLVYFGFKLLRDSVRVDRTEPAAVAATVPAGVHGGAAAVGAGAAGAAGEAMTMAMEASAMGVAGQAHAWRVAYRSGLVTCMTNPKSCVFWTSVFAALFPAHPPLWFYGAVLAVIGSLSAGWYSSVALMFAAERTQRGYRRLRRPIDGLCGVALAGLGVKLAFKQ
ncbi:LysE family transporter [Trinickia caryophylli]|uniref:Threonine/homoserine/homoserine lactone efflux protein n=1 Tax=Trinickia caryophylli TaxID=28094 RepID=A0A1X7FIR5_TRICW|nr:LysE family transporter [Trinickia caryophylli]PMS13243.1 lysine transporter LysE [Trinickia caryophylli]TRX19232.1 LysE family translocator [Trinickia caryophylli]WQE13469.1 LysE family transporter [Trinickia caryophylli]SMF52325.1 Threonine/homoserine/homoserine lactone efflux protein [Trinickia caryophylli]GLU34004.1 threonine efflux protein [Trinickia caryophylli]